MNSITFIVFHYYLERGVDVAHYTTTNALFNAEIRILQSNCIFFEDSFFKPMKMKGNDSCLYRAVSSHQSSSLNDVWTDRFPPGMKSGIKPATFWVVNDLKKYISQKDNDVLQKKVPYTQI